METDQPAKATLTDLVLEFLEAIVHEFLFAWHVYPKEAFEKRVLYDIPIHMSRHPLLCEYIHSMLIGCRAWLLQGELERLCVILLCKEGRTTETLMIELVWSAALVDEKYSGEGYQLPLRQLEEAFRSVMVALVARRAKESDSTNKPHTFRILAQTVEDANSQDTVINDDTISNSWVLADPFWCENMRREIMPVKSIYEDSLPIQLNLYVEKQEQRPN